jgi:Rps23 Pro-64 3,4-dihydroxylase Tpa1-like proline 4-hydroxylase
MFLNFDNLEQCLPERQWSRPAKQNPAITIMDDLLHSAKRKEVFESFPKADWNGWDRIGDSLQFKKLSCDRSQLFPPSLGAVVHELHSGPFLRWLESLTGISNLMPDPHLWGGGLHLTEPGGYLWPHTDFLQGKVATLMRVLNLVLFVHPRWEPEMGGHFQLWENDSLIRSIVPAPGRCIIFKTDSLSIHGVSRVSGLSPRQSIAVFYYTVLDRPDYSIEHTAGWRLEIVPSGATVRGIRHMAAHTLMRASFGAKKLAVLLNNKAEAMMNS